MAGARINITWEQLVHPPNEYISKNKYDYTFCYVLNQRVMLILCPFLKRCPLAPQESTKMSPKTQNQSKFILNNAI